ncbi:MAG: urate hydroxylase PuuD [Gammaproteobacteria bacterium]|nr:urate hydroxylase PuuD [Gammaproteobacteria bacterium]NNF60735.1 antitermination protein NusG [Gammaproteobacteria bacterium]NNM20254.1 antitermination protein NusG [Gammaproteobacteria bacterium]
MALIDFLFRWGHVLFGITWIGLLYYFNFVQGSYFAEADAGAKADATKKLVPRALWWFRWGAMFTFLTGVYLLWTLGKGANQYILLGALMGIFMFLNVWLIIWPAQKIVIGINEGDAGKAGPKALLASRTNTLFSGPMLFGMLGSKHGAFSMAGFQAPSFSDLGFMLALIVILVLEANAIVGKVGPMKSVVGVIHSSLALTAVIFAIVHFL